MRGLALATALSAMVHLCVLSGVLAHRLGGMDWRRVGCALGRAGLAAIPVILACAWVAGLAVWQREDEWVAKGVMLTVGIGLSVTGYLGTQALLRSEEQDVLWNVVQRHVPFVRARKG